MLRRPCSSCGRSWRGPGWLDASYGPPVRTTFGAAVVLLALGLGMVGAACVGGDELPDAEPIAECPRLTAQDDGERAVAPPVDPANINEGGSGARISEGGGEAIGGPVTPAPDVVPLSPPQSGPMSVARRLFEYGVCKHLLGPKKIAIPAREAFCRSSQVCSYTLRTCWEHRFDSDIGWKNWCYNTYIGD